MMKYKRIAIVFQTLLWGIFLMDIYASAALPVQELEAVRPPGMQKPDYEIKAGLIAKFVDYCKWPPASPAENSDTPFTIGAFEKNELVSYLKERLETRKIKGKKTEIVIISGDEEIKKCHLLYISKIPGKRLEEILTAVGSQPILTVADSQDYAEKGVMINMFKKDRKIRFNVNLAAARENHLVLSARFLKYAVKIIKE
jgi:hypothetical protein